MEKRKSERQEIKCTVILEARNNIVFGHTKNISLGGTVFTTADYIDKDVDFVLVKMINCNMVTDSLISKIVRRTEIEFNSKIKYEYGLEFNIGETLLEYAIKPLLR